MTEPSLLHTAPAVSASPTISAQTMRDLYLDRFFGERELEVLRCPCRSADIIARKELLRQLDDPEVRSGFDELRLCCASLSQNLSALDAASGEYERVMTFRRFAESFLGLSDAIARLPDEGALICSLKAAARERDGSLQALRDGLDSCTDAYSELAELRVCCSAKGIYTDENNVSQSMQRRFEAATGALGFKVKSGSNPLLRGGDGFSAAVKRSQAAAFDAAAGFMRDCREYVECDFAALRHEIDFYTSVRALRVRAESAGIPCCYPELAVETCFNCTDAYDVTLLLKQDCAPIPNDIDFDGTEKVFFLTGANSGGKTTYLRTVAVNLVLALAGAPVFARRAVVGGYDSVYTHFPRDEIFSESGRMAEEELRMRELLGSVSSGSFVFLNETFSGTNEEKGAALTLEYARRLRDSGVSVLYVTHFHEVTDSGIPALTTMLDPDDSAHRTYKIVRRTSEKSSRARDFLIKYGLDAASLERRQPQ